MAKAIASVGTVLIQMIFDQRVHLRLFMLIGRSDRFVGFTPLSGATVNR